MFMRKLTTASALLLCSAMLMCGGTAIAGSPCSEKAACAEAKKCGLRLDRGKCPKKACDDSCGEKATSAPRPPASHKPG